MNTHVSVIAGGVVAPRPRRCPAVLRGVPVPGRQRGHAALAMRLGPMGHGAHARAEPPVGLLPRMPPDTGSIVFRPVSRG